MSASELKLEWQGYYAGGIPPLAFFYERTEEIKRLASSAPLQSSVILELCFIGLASYFEAYCKAQFAAVINICPQVLEEFSESREVSVRLKQLLTIVPDITYRLGSLLSEEFNFGSAKSINGLFRDILNITPFSKDEMKRFAVFINDRNLLVHHGGIFTFKYKRRKFTDKLKSDIAQRKSLVISKEEIEDWAKFLWHIAEKLANSIQPKLKELMLQKTIEIDTERETAISGLNIS
jgi:hypothetical protein